MGLSAHQMPFKSLAARILSSGPRGLGSGFGASQMAGYGASPVPVRPGEGPFSIAASVKRRPDDFMLSCCHPLAPRLMTPHEALASLRGRRQAAS
jgi:hypothetical protein